ncbi:MAG: glycoside hydrolase family 140 protein [Rikenellaceae bacterium]|jgi:hypothetical protein|nr:glycoside hydrolase family 140 protein [Rikenellaceae bacterium]
MKTLRQILLTVLVCVCATSAVSAQQRGGGPWSHGKLKVSDNHRYLCYEDGTPFFWLGDTGWLLPQNLTRSEVGNYLSERANQGYNVVQVQVVNGIPNINAYGQYSFTDTDHFDEIDKPGVYGYWDHVDYIVRTAASRGIYIGMVPTWGGPVKSGVFSKEGAVAYAKFLALRYKDSPNIIWLNGGDLNPESTLDVWNAMGQMIKQHDPNHLMTFHPIGRTSSVTWFNDAPWLDFNMFQSGHRRYGQMLRRDGNVPYTGKFQEEDSWRYVEEAFAKKPQKPVIDGEPSYEGIPQGLHDTDEPVWQAGDVRRYAYWSVFAGSFGHTYGSSAIMQFTKSGAGGGYGNRMLWTEALYLPGAQQLKYLKNLILSVPFFDRIPDQSVLIGNTGERYDRIIATRGNDYILAYTYNGCDIEVDLTKISGAKKDAWWMNPRNGEMTYIGSYDGKSARFYPAGRYRVGNDWVLVVTDASKDYFKK